MRFGPSSESRPGHDGLSVFLGTTARGDGGACALGTEGAMRSPSSPNRHPSSPDRRHQRAPPRCRNGGADPGSPPDDRSHSRRSTRRCDETSRDRNTATNKLLRAAIFELRDSGRCEVKVTVDSPSHHAQVRFELDVAEPRDDPVPDVFASNLVFPFAVVVFYGVHRGLVREEKPVWQPGSTDRPPS